MSDEEDHQYEDPSVITEDSPIQKAADKPVFKRQEDLREAPDFVSFSEFKYEIERQRDIYEEEIIALNEELEQLRHMGGRIIAEKTEGLKLENRMLREELAKAGVEMSVQSSPGQEPLSKSEELKLQEYYEAMRLQKEAEQNQNFKSPQVVGFDQYWDYGSERQTASANYRPGNSNTILRKPRSRIASGASAKISVKEGQSLIEINEEQSSFQNFKRLLREEDKNSSDDKKLVDFSPIQNQKYSEEKTQPHHLDLKSSHTSIKSSEEEQHSNDENQVKDRTQKSLEREFDQIAKEYPEELPRSKAQSPEQPRVEETRIRPQNECRPRSNQHRYPAYPMPVHHPRVCGHRHDVYQPLRVSRSPERDQYNKTAPSPPESRRQAAVKMVNPDFQSPSRQSHDDGPRLQSYKEHLKRSIEKRAISRHEEEGEIAMTEINRANKMVGQPIAQTVVYKWQDRGTNNFQWTDNQKQQTSSSNGQYATATEIRAQALEKSSKKKMRNWNPEIEKYMHFTVTTGITRPEESNLNMSPEGKMRRKLMFDHGAASASFGAEPAYTAHYEGPSMKSKLLNEQERLSSSMKVNLGTRQYR